jgi:lipopolysaccharide transport system ATP-binding protein
METVIRVENLGKAYQITRTAHRYRTIQEDVIDWVRRPLRREKSPSRTETFWALQDVSFEVKQGDVVGIIGRNGAGKSTLLKILSRITRPTTGSIDLYGRVGSLLEVGTGFHPELTGRENIYLNGAILGMTRPEIRRKFDEIVAFAEVEQFLDTPVKRYSSGMYMRLAFAVAAHLEPEILVVDEVLAVGDAEFQKKSLGKMSEVAKGGRTVLFVSHQMSAVQALCQRAILLEQGQIALSGDVGQVVTAYLARGLDQSGTYADSPRSGNGKAKVTHFHLENAAGEIIPAATSGMPTTFVFEIENCGLSPTDRLSFGFSVQNAAETPIFFYYSHFSNVYFRELGKTSWIRCELPDLPLTAGDYLVGCRVVSNGDDQTGEVVDYPKNRVSMTVNTVDYYGTGSAYVPSWGSVVVRGNWSASEHRAG